jgi:hypothetical protein
MLATMPRRAAAARSSLPRRPCGAEPPRPSSPGRASDVDSLCDRPDGQTPRCRSGPRRRLRSTGAAIGVSTGGTPPDLGRSDTRMVLATSGNCTGADCIRQLILARLRRRLGPGVSGTRCWRVTRHGVRLPAWRPICAMDSSSQRLSLRWRQGR